MSEECPIPHICFEADKLNACFGDTPVLVHRADNCRLSRPAGSITQCMSESALPALPRYIPSPGACGFSDGGSSQLYEDLGKALAVCPANMLLFLAAHS